MKQTLEEAAIEHQNGFETCEYDGTISGFINGKKAQSRISFIAGAEWQQKQYQWINVEERYPSFDKDNNKDYLVRVSTGSIKQSIYYAASPLVSRNRFGIEMDWTRVTHWMPIPSFDEILKANRDVLERIKEKGD